MEQINLTENQIEAMTPAEAEEAIERVKESLAYLNDILLLLKVRAGPEITICGNPSCKAPKKYLRFRKDGTYYCSKCGHSTGTGKILEVS